MSLAFARTCMLYVATAVCCGALCSVRSGEVQAQDSSEQRKPGPSAELCPEHALDSDGDTVCDNAERYYGTDPSNRDSDGDALDDAAELFGMWFEPTPMPAPVNGQPHLLDLPALGANPLHRDVFVEIDYFPRRVPDKDALDMVVAAFRAARVANPDGNNGVELHYLIDSAIEPEDEIEVLGDPAAPPAQPSGNTACVHESTPTEPAVYCQLQRIKSKYADHMRHSAFHYALYGYQAYGGFHGVSFYIDGHDFVMTPPSKTNPFYPHPFYEAALFMHELGHNLGLCHGGDVEATKPNYFSIMSYNYQEKGVVRNGQRVLDYSSVAVAALSESALDEQLGMAPGPGATEADLESYGVVTAQAAEPQLGDASGPLDFDGDGEYATTPIAYDLDGDGTIGVIAAAQNDWENLSYSAHGSIGSLDSWNSYVANEVDPTCVR